MVAAHSSSSSSRHTSNERQQSNAFPSPSTSSSHLHSVNGTRRVAAVAAGYDDEGLVMREKKEKDDGSVGKAGAVGVGVTRPKRRLSSLPSLPHPFLSSRPVPISSNTPPGSPNGTPRIPSYSTLPHSTYQPLHNGLIASATTPTSYQSTQSTYRPSPARTSSPRVDEKGGAGFMMAACSTVRDREGSPRLWGIELKWISLVTLALQNAFLTIIMHYSRISVSPHKSYSAASAVFLNELIKGAVSVVIALSRIDADMLASAQSRVYAEKDSQNTERRPSYSWRSPFHSSRLRSLTKSVFSPDCYKLSVPAILYVIQNNLQYVAASNLDVATFQVTYQMKILTTAFFSVLLLRRRLSKMKWASLVMLAVGVAIVQLQSTTAPATQLSKKTVKMGTTNSAATGESLIAPDRVMRPFHGFLAVTLACMTSGLAGVYFEFILKASSGSTPPPDLWIRNTQLSLFSLVPALIPILFAPSGPEGAGLLGRIMTSFSNFNGWALGTVLTQTLGGLITAIVIRYSDNIMKGFATSLSIIISFLASVALFSYPITLAFIVGSSIVLASTYLYNAPASPSTPPTRVDVGVSPGSPIPLTAPILGEPDRPSRASSVINLFGLGSSSGSSSRQPSFHDLRGQAQSQLSFTHMNTPHHAHGFYSASAPGSPYLSSGHPIMTSMYDNSKASTSPDMNIPPSRTRSPGLRMSGSDGSGCDRPVLSVETGEKQRLMD